MFPMPATSRWSWQRLAERRRLARAAQPPTAARARGSSASTSGPEPPRGAAARASSTGPFQSTASCVRPRAARATGQPARCAPARLHPPAAGHAQMAADDEAALERGAAGSCRPPRPTRARARRARGATRSPGRAGSATRPRACWPTSGWSRRAARWSASPSGTVTSLELVFSAHATVPAPTGRAQRKRDGVSPDTDVRHGRAHAVRPYDATRRFAAGRPDRGDHDRRRRRSSISRAASARRIPGARHPASRCRTRPASTRSGRGDRS